MLVCYRPRARRGLISQPETSAPAVAKPTRTPRLPEDSKGHLSSGGLRITALKAAHGRYKHPYKQSAVGSLAPEALVSSLQWARARTIRKRTNRPS